MRARLALLSCLLATNLAAADEWASYGRDPQNTRYVPLAQITPGNVTRLKPVWTFHTGDISDGRHGSHPSGFESTPLMLDGRLYLTTPFNRVIALDPATGRQLWAYDPKIDRGQDYGATTGPARPVRCGCSRRHWMRACWRWTPPPARPAPNSAMAVRSICAA
jgi:glucose dehydrogenase